MSSTLITEDIATKTGIDIITNKRGEQALFEQILALRAKRRAGTANTKTRAEVKGSSSKPWRQKGTGRARHGDQRSPIWRGGGVTFGPKPRSYAQKINKKVKKLALQKALSERIKDEAFIKVDGFKIEDGKTKSYIKSIDEITKDKKVCVVSDNFDDMTIRSANNVKNKNLITSSLINVEELLYYDKIIIVGDALTTLAKRTQFDKKNTSND